MKGHKQSFLCGDGHVVSMQDIAMDSKSTSSVPGLNASRYPSKLGEMLEQKKIDEAWRLISGQRLRVALEVSDPAAAAFYRAGSRKR